MAKYTLSDGAIDDLRGITRYTLANFGLAQAEKYIDQLHRSAQIAADFPATGKRYLAANGATYRQYNCGRHAIFYREEEGGIFIGRILHQMMDFDRHL